MDEEKFDITGTIFDELTSRVESSEMDNSGSPLTSLVTIEIALIDSDTEIQCMHALNQVMQYFRYDPVLDEGAIGKLSFHAEARIASWFKEKYTPRGT